MQRRNRRPGLWTFLLPLAGLLAGCFSSSSGPTPSAPPAGATGGPAAVTDTTGLSPEAKAAAEEYDRLCAKYPDVPRVELTKEIDGVPIPRWTPKGIDYKVGGELPVDVGNESAKKRPAQPATGGRVVVRFSGEPKSLNALTGVDAYQTYILDYVQDSLAWQNKETLKYEPKLASEWVIEDSVKLSADYPGHVRRIKAANGQPAATLEIDAPKPKSEKEPVTLTFTTLDGDGQPVGNVWVGLFAKNLKEMAGAPTNGVHQWSDGKGILEVSGLVPGKYDVKVGDELYGISEQAEDGTLTVKAGTEENPLHKQLVEAKQESLVLKPGEWINLQRQTIFTYYLRPEATWSDGRPFTARDLEFAYQTIRNPLVDAESLRVYYSDLLECTPLTPHVVRMKYREQYFLAFEFTFDLASVTPPWHFFEELFRQQGKELTLERLTAREEEQQGKVSVHGQAFAQFFNSDSRYNDKPLGVGPYVVDRWTRHDQLVLKRRNDYWDQDRAGYLDEIVFKFIDDDTTAFQALRAGEVDFAYRLTAEQYYEDLDPPPPWFKGKYVKGEWFTPGYSFIGWNLLRPQFVDSRVRMALAMLFNTKEWIEKRLHGGAIPVSGSEYIFGKGYDKSVMPIAFDPDAAAQMLTAAGWVDSNNDGILDRNGVPLRFKAQMSTGSKAAEDLMATLQSECKRVGIDMQIQTLEWAAYLENVQNKDYDVCTMSWAQSLESDPYQLWHSSGAGVGKRSSNQGSFANPLADQLIELIRVTLDEEKRMCAFASFHRLLDRQQPYLFLYTRKEFGAYHQKFRGVKWYPLRPGFDLRRWWIAKADQK